ncbi:hypothetical protein NHX12_017244 [Muraenolepis orangiensis]|uniref:Uncharacterized protein n=1 Tax=Muraenolepis orangiensis TaxID=630683 RepID=A0A9Q0I0J0_9TELE|nr:hypothetical protein NHX12_017244 [Muraenolepis orangiensis]
MSPEEMGDMHAAQQAILGFMLIISPEEMGDMHAAQQAILGFMLLMSPEEMGDMHAAQQAILGFMLLMSPEEMGDMHGAQQAILGFMSATRRSSSTLRRNLYLVFLYVSAEKLFWHMYVEPNGVRTSIVAMESCGYSPSTEIQNSASVFALKAVFNVRSLDSSACASSMTDDR